MHKSQYYIGEKTFDKLSKLTTSMLDQDGREVNNPTSNVKIKGEEVPLTLKEQIQRILRTEVSNQVAEQGLESFEEANDFDVEDSFDEPLAHTIYEEVTEEFITEDPTSERPSEEDGQNKDPEPTKVEDPVSSEEKPTEKAVE